MFNIGGRLDYAEKKNTQPFSPCEDVIRNLQPRNAPSSCQADTLPSASASRTNYKVHIKREW